MQDEIVARLANALNAELIAAEARRAEQAPNPDSMDLYFQGLAWFNKGVTLDQLAQAHSFFDRALTADPNNVEALIGSRCAEPFGGNRATAYMVTEKVAYEIFNLGDERFAATSDRQTAPVCAACVTPAEEADSTRERACEGCGLAMRSQFIVRTCSGGAPCASCGRGGDI
jgi:hypothetical protein